MAAFYLEVI